MSFISKKSRHRDVKWLGYQDQEMKSLYFGRISCLAMASYLLSFWEWYYYITVWGSPQTKETSFFPAVWDILGWNWEDDHFHINWGGPRFTSLLPTLLLPTPCSSCGLHFWAKGASFDATSDEGSNLWSFFGSLPQRMSQPLSTLCPFPQSTLPFASPSVWPLLWSSLTVGFPNTSPLLTGCSSSSSSSQKMKQKRN